MDYEGDFEARRAESCYTALLEDQIVSLFLYTPAITLLKDEALLYSFASGV